MREKVQLVPVGSVQAARDALLDIDTQTTLRDLLRQVPGVIVAPFTPELLDRTIDDLRISFVEAQPAHTYVLPPGGLAALVGSTAAVDPSPPSDPAAAAPANPPTPDDPCTSPAGHPETLTPAEAVARAYRTDIDAISSFLRARLSVLISCDKLIVPHLADAIASAVRLPRPGVDDGVLHPVPLTTGKPPEGPLAPSPVDELRAIVEALKSDQYLVVPHLDLLAGGDRNLSREARDVIELVYHAADSLLLAFTDTALTIPDTLASRFAVRVSISGLHREVRLADGRPLPTGVGLVTETEAAMFADYDPALVYKNVAGLNPIRLRDAFAWAVRNAREAGHTAAAPASREHLVSSIRAFKAQGSDQFDIPTTRFEDIGGYDEVKDTLRRVLALMRGAGNLPSPELRSELVPRGFLFHGPPGTGKTLFAKAIASELDGTIRVVSGPEITDKYVGEGERKVRELFNEARRNAPSVLVFDEFDAIAAQRSGLDDGGSRAGNAMVAQILTEMDGFRPDVPMLVIGTTNRLSLIDEALLRPSRFQPVAIGIPLPAARPSIAKIHADHFKVFDGHTPEVDLLLKLVADATDGFNGDEIRSVFREACVARYVEHKPVDAWLLGWLVGRVRAARDEQGPPDTTHAPVIRNGRRGFSGGQPMRPPRDLPPSGDPA
jgi:transitional endoplasmic reticulum ATPase